MDKPWNYQIHEIVNLCGDKGGVDSVEKCQNSGCNLLLIWKKEGGQRDVDIWLVVHDNVHSLALITDPGLIAFPLLEFKG
jgi:hypothetical protein